MMKKHLAIAALTACIALAACQDKAKTDAENVAAAENAAAANAAIIADMPPPIKSSKPYRCGDNSLIYVDLFSGDKQAVLREKKDGTPVKLVAEEAGKPMTADGYAIEIAGENLKVTMPGKKAQTCKG